MNQHSLTAESVLAGRHRLRKELLLGGFTWTLQSVRETRRRFVLLEDLLGSEVVFLNDFDYDADAPKWMPWGYFKDFQEGSNVKVAVPKQRGGNQVFKGGAPVFAAAFHEVVLRKYNKEVEAETRQMRKRFKYLPPVYN